MADSPTSRLLLRLQETGANTNTWGDLLDIVMQLVDDAIAGMATVALTGDYTLTRTNFVTNEARHAILKLTGSVASTVTIPGVSKLYVVWNASSAIQTVSTGAGTTIAIDPDDIVLLFCDAVNVKTLSYGGLTLKQYIAASVLAATGSLPATTGNNGKFLGVVAGSWVPVNIASSDISDFTTNRAADRAFAVAMATAL